MSHEEDVDRDVETALDTATQELANESSAVTWSTLGDEGYGQIEEAGFDPDSAIAIAESGDAVAVDGSLNVPHNMYDASWLHLKRSAGSLGWREAEDADGHNALYKLRRLVLGEEYAEVPGVSGKIPGGDFEEFGRAAIADRAEELLAADATFDGPRGGRALRTLVLRLAREELDSTVSRESDSGEITVYARAKYHWFAIPYSVTDQENDTVTGAVIVKAENQTEAETAMLSAVGYQGSGAEEELWGSIPDYMETMVEHSGDSAFYISGADYDAVEEDEEPESETMLLTVDFKNAKEYSSLEEAESETREKFDKRYQRLSRLHVLDEELELEEL